MEGNLTTTIIDSTSTTSTWMPYRDVTKLDPAFSEWRCGYCHEPLGTEESPNATHCSRCGATLSVRVATVSPPRFITVREPAFHYT